MLLATTQVEDFDRFMAVFSTAGAEKRKQHGSKGALVFRDPSEEDRVWVIFDWDEQGWQSFVVRPRGPADHEGSRAQVEAAGRAVRRPSATPEIDPPSGRRQQDRLAPPTASSRREGRHVQAFLLAGSARQRFRARPVRIVPGMPAADTIDASAGDLRRATLAVYAVFFGAGFAFSNWAARIPQVRDGLHLSPAKLGLLLLSIAAGSVLALPLAGLVIARLGAARTITVMAILAAGGLAIAAVGYRSGVAPVVVGLFLLGAGNGTWDVAMNVEGAFVEQRLERSIMPRFHAGFSIGMVTGALIGAGMVLADISVTVHLLIVAAVIARDLPWVVRWFLTVAAPARREGEPAGTRSRPGRSRARSRSACSCSAWRSSRGPGTTGSAWPSSTATTRRAAVGSLTLGIFLGAMTAGRWFGPALLDRFGRVASVRASGLLACAGLLLVVFGGSLPLAVGGRRAVGAWGARSASRSA